jgi:regulatory protein
MRRPPKKLLTETDLYAAAMRALMRRAHSVHEMRLALERRSGEDAALQAVMQRLKRGGYLDDARFALEFARSHARVRRQGKFRIARELRTRGVPDRHVKSALEAVFAEWDESALLRERLERRLKLMRGPLDERKYASLYGNLMRAGFSPDAIRRELNRLRSKTTAGHAGDGNEAGEPDFEGA